MGFGNGQAVWAVRGRRIGERTGFESDRRWWRGVLSVGDEEGEEDEDGE